MSLIWTWCPLQLLVTLLWQKWSYKTSYKWSHVHNLYSVRMLRSKTIKIIEKQHKSVVFRNTITQPYLLSCLPLCITFYTPLNKINLKVIFLTRHCFWGDSPWQKHNCRIFKTEVSQPASDAKLLLENCLKNTGFLQWYQKLLLCAEWQFCTFR